MLRRTQLWARTVNVPRIAPASPPAGDHPWGASSNAAAVRAEELLGTSIGMWIDGSLHLTGALNDSHVAALLEIAKRRQQEPIDLADDGEDGEGHRTRDD